MASLFWRESLGPVGMLRLLPSSDEAIEQAFNPSHALPQASDVPVQAEYLPVQRPDQGYHEASEADNDLNGLRFHAGTIPQPPADCALSDASAAIPARRFHMSEAAGIAGRKCGGNGIAGDGPALPLENR